MGSEKTLKIVFNSIEWCKQRPWIAEILACFAMVLYFTQSWVFAHTRDSVLDEGLYLLKGYLFLTGKYEPFQDYGVETNHMPLSFLIPGFFQYAFGPGLRTGRYYAIVISLLFFLGSWLVSRKLGGRWWAAFIALTLAMNPMMVKEYSVAVSQGLVACLLVWSLYFTLGDNDRPWQVLFGAFLAGVLLMTRINMFAVFPFLIFYIFWKYGIKLGIFSTIIGILPVVWGHIQYYPGIMILWAKWIPEDISPFLLPWRFQGMNQIPDAGITSLVRIRGFFQGFSLHTFSWLAVIISILSWPRIWKRKSKGEAYLLFSLYIFLFILHAWATLGGTHCIFCFSWYQYFFEIIAIFILVVSCKSWQWKLNRLQKGIFWGMIAFATIILVIGSAYGLNKSFPAGLIKWVEVLKEMSVPRFVNGQFLPGQIKVWGFIANVLGSSSRYLDPQPYQIVGDWMLAFLIFLSGGVFIWITWWTTGWLKRRGMLEKYFDLNADRTSLVIVLLLFFVWLLTPFGFWGKNYDDYDCGYNIIDTYESAGKQLSREIQPGVKVFWWGGDTQSVLLYLQDVDFYPALFNADFSRREGKATMLERHGLWNDALFKKWAQETEIFLVESRFFNGWLKDYLSTGGFDEMEQTGEIGCRGSTRLHVFVREHGSE